MEINSNFSFKSFKFNFSLGFLLNFKSLSSSNICEQSLAYFNLFEYEIFGVESKGISRSFLTGWDPSQHFLYGWGSLWFFFQKPLKNWRNFSKWGVGLTPKTSFGYQLNWILKVSWKIWTKSFLWKVNDIFLNAT